MNDRLELNRLEYLILKSLHEMGCIDRFHGMTITEIMEETDNALGVRMTVYRKLNKLLKAGYVGKGVMDNHADTFYLLDKGNRLFDGGKEE